MSDTNLSSVEITDLDQVSGGTRPAPAVCYPTPMGPVCGPRPQPMPWYPPARGGWWPYVRNYSYSWWRGGWRR